MEKNKEENLNKEREIIDLGDKPFKEQLKVLAEVCKKINEQCENSKVVSEEKKEEQQILQKENKRT